jgi:hypothetical protein
METLAKTENFARLAGFQSCKPLMHGGIVTMEPLIPIPQRSLIFNLDAEALRVISKLVGRASDMEALHQKGLSQLCILRGDLELWPRDCLQHSQRLFKFCGGRLRHYSSRAL